MFHLRLGILRRIRHEHKREGGIQIKLMLMLTKVYGSLNFVHNKNNLILYIETVLSCLMCQRT